MTILKPKKIIRKTPIEKLRGLKTHTQIFIKRDDLTGLLISGNKARKLEYLIADAKNKKCDTLITSGGIQSNHARATAAFANYFGFDCHLLLCSHRKPKRIYTANLLIDRLLGSTVHYITPTQYKRRNEVMKELARKLVKKGKKTYVIPVGGSNAVGVLGYIDCMKEMKDYIKKEKIQAVYCAVGSGGTYAGLLLGKKLLKLNIDINGILVSDTTEYFNKEILKICHSTIDAYHLNTDVYKEEMNLIDGFIGEGYAIPYPAELRTIYNVARLGIILDPVYTGKTFYGMLCHLKKRKYRKVIFIHTGGIFSIFAFAKDLTKVIDRQK